MHEGRGECRGVRGRLSLAAAAGVGAGIVPGEGRRNAGTLLPHLQRPYIGSIGLWNRWCLGKVFLDPAERGRNQGGVGAVCQHAWLGMWHGLRLLARGAAPIVTIVLCPRERIEGGNTKNTFVRSYKHANEACKQTK